MELSSFIQLRPPYDSFIQQKRWKEYVENLCQEGIRWWFNMEIPTLFSHLMPLNQTPMSGSLPLRLAFLREAVNLSIPIESMETFYRLFMEENDLEAASAAAGAGTASIFDSGLEFSRFETWYQRIEDLLNKGDRISPLARASLFGFRGMVEIVYLGDNAKASATYKEQLFWAEKARSNSLRVFHAAAHGYNLLYLGDLPEMELLLSEVTPLLDHPETSLICRLYHQVTLGMFNVNRGTIPEAKRILLEVMSHPLFDLLPPPVWLLGSSHYLLATAIEGDAEGVETVFRKIQNRTVSEQNYFHHGYIHFSMGLASLLLGHPYKALIHARQAIEKGRLSESPIPERVGSFLLGQALSDLGRTQEAMDHLVRWVEEWERVGYSLFASAGCMELSNLLIKEGKLKEAKKYYERIATSLSIGEIPPRHPLRAPEFIENLKNSLFPPAAGVVDWAEPGAAPIQIQTFGQFVVKAGDKVLYDRKWRGGRTKTLLKALIANGGEEISINLLTDLLWPDSDGDMANQNLKVALSRLRHIGCQKGEEPLPWIMVRHGQVSLTKSLCSVDAIHFQVRMKAAMQRKNDINLFLMALDLYKDDFLANDQSELWIIKHREILREDFIRGVKSLAQLCHIEQKPDLPIPYLEKAIGRDPLDESLYLYLMRSYMGTGYPSKALMVFKKAEAAIQREFNIAPGPALTSLACEAGLKK